MKRKRRTSPIELTVKPITAAVAAALGTGYGATALAQEGVIEEIVVTATRRTATVQDIPINITAIGGQALRDQRMVGLEEIARQVPGLQIVDRGPRDATTDIICRGLNTSGLGPGFTSDAVATYLGEIPLQVDLKTNDLERVEVLIGPQGTLYGSGTLGGAVRYIPRKPQPEFEAEVRANGFILDQSDGFGSDVGFTVNFPLVDDTLAVRASIDFLDDPGYIDYGFVVQEGGVSNPQPDFTNPGDVAANLTNVKDANGEETLSARLGLRWTPNDNWDATLWYYYQDVEAEGRTLANVEAIGTGRYEAGYRYIEPSNYKNELFSVEIIGDLGFAELTAAAGLSDFSQLGQRDQTDLLLDFEYGYELFPSFSSFTREIDDQENTTLELRLVSSSGGPLSWIGGFFYNKFEQFATSEEFVPGFDDWALVNFGAVQLRPDELEYLQITDDEVTESAFYGELSYDFADDWQVTVGARLYEFEETLSGGFGLPLYDTIFLGYPQDFIDVPLTTNSTDDDGSLFKLNVSRNFNQDILGYFTIANGYRIGGVNSIVECSVADINNPGQALCALPDEVLIKPDETTSYEFGVHSTLANGSLVLNGAVYFIDWDAIQVDDVTANGSLPITGNGSKAESKGFDISTNWLINDNWTFTGTWSYNTSELTALAPGLVGPLDAPSGTRLPGSPEHQGTVALTYSTTLSSGWDLDVRYGAMYMGGIFNIPGGDEVPSLIARRGEEIPGYTIQDLTATLSGDQWRAQLYIDNLADEYVITGTRTTRRFNEQFRGTVNGFSLRSYGHYIGRPRTVGVNFTYLF